MTGTNQPQGALRGIRVLDFGHYVAGPMLGMLLADQGADVIKVERPGGDPARSQTAFATWNRGKRSIILDLKSAEDQTKAQRLAEGTDVVIENFRPGVADHLGIGYSTLTAANRGLVYCSLPGFSEHSPHRDRPGWDPIVSAETGVYQSTDGTDDEPLFIPLPLVSTFGAIVASVSVTMALIARQRTGLGQRIEAPLHTAIFTTMGTRILKLHDQPPQSPLLYRPVMMHQYLCADGRWIQNHGVYSNFVPVFTGLIERPEWADELLSEQLGAQNDETLAKWRGRFAELFRQKTSVEWEDAIGSAGGAGAVCRSIDEWMVHEQALAAGIVEEVEDPTLGRMKQPGVQVHLRGTPGAIQGPSPRLGEHTESVLADSPDTVRGREQPSSADADILGALQGLRVLDLCIVLAGPTIGRTLGEYGADVIKIDDPSRDFEISLSTDVNRGKRSIILDLKREEGREIFWRLVDSADVVLENYRKGSLARLGLGYEEMRKRKPEIIYSYANAYGADGPWAGRPGWEQLAQATSGMQVRRGGRDGTPTLMPYPINDYGTGMLGAFAVALAVHERNRTGLGQAVDSSLTMTACLFQSPYFLDYPGYERNDLEGLGVRGYSALSRLYPASDAWLYLHCADQEEWGRLTTLKAFEALGADRRFADPQSRVANDSELASALTDIFRDRPREDWLDLLASAEVNAMENVTVNEFRHYQHVRDAGLIITRDHPGIGSVDHLGNTVFLSRTPMRLGRPSPVLGAETEEILQETGYSVEEIERLKVAGTIKQT